MTPEFSCSFALYNRVIRERVIALSELEDGYAIMTKSIQATIPRNILKKDLETDDTIEIYYYGNTPVALKVLS